jgi:hypothetical protein
MAIHTRLDELRLLTKISNLYHEQGYIQGSMLSPWAASIAYVVQSAGGPGPFASEVHLAQLVRKLGFDAG